VRTGQARHPIARLLPYLAIPPLSGTALVGGGRGWKPVEEASENRSALAISTWTTSPTLALILTPIAAAPGGLEWGS
jgi:hypothetical protein